MNADPVVLLTVAGTWLAGGLFLLAGVWGYRRWSGTAGEWFATTFLVLAAGALGVGVTYTVPGEVSLLSTGIYPLVVLVMPIVWSRFVLEYYGLFDLTSTRRTVALLAPAVLGAVAGTWIGITTGGAPTGTSSVVVWVYLGYVLVHFYSAAVLVVSMALLARLSVEGSGVDAPVASLLAGIAVTPWLGNFLNGVLRVGSLSLAGGVDELIRMAGFLTGAVAAVLVIVQCRLFEQYPAARTASPETVLTEMDDLVVVVDRPGTVVRANDAAREAFAGEDDLVGRPARTVLGTTAGSLVDRDDVRLETTTGPRQFDPSVSTLTDDRGEVIGYTLVLRDVTERQTRRQRLSVLNRVLRHNLRNETTTIVTRADVIAEETDGEPAAMADDISDTALEIADIGTKARRIERMMAVPATPDPRTDLGDLLAPLVADVRDRYRCRLSLSCPSDAVVGTDSRILYPVLEDVVENAIEHNDRDRPQVEVSVEVTPEARLPVTVSVADDGPGIPEAEREPLLAGDEEKLRHGSGLGLWGVRWGVTRMGGELRFDENEPRGTVVHLSLPTPAGADGTERVGPSETALSGVTDDHGNTATDGRDEVTRVPASESERH